MYDVIVVGARVAGSSVARLLAKKGHSVLIVDRSKFPSNIMSTHFLWQPAVSILKRWELFEKILQSGCPVISKVTSHYGDFSLEGIPPPYEGTTEMFAPHRSVLDKILLDSALESGVDFLDGVTIRGVRKEEGRVVGVEGNDKDGKFTKNAKVVIGADGKNSIIASSVGAKKYNELPAETGILYSYFSEVALGHFQMDYCNNRMHFAYPTHFNQHLASVIFNLNDLDKVRENKDFFFKTSYEGVPELKKMLLNAKQEDVYYLAGSLPNFYREAWGPGWALVGDAGYTKDPILAQGIGDSFKHAEFLADAVHSGLTGISDMDQALSHYEVLRNESSKEGYEFNYKNSKLSQSKMTMELRTAIKGNEVETNRYFGLFSGAVKPQEYFSKQNLKNILFSKRTTR